MAAWLDTTPEKSKQARRTNWTGSEPDAGPLSYIADWLYEIGAVQNHSGSLAPISWADLDHWMSATKTEASPFELNTLIDLSRLYLNSHHEAKNPHCVAPWLDPDRIDQNALIEKRRRRHAK